MARTATYYAFLMYRPFQGAAALPVNVRSPDYAVAESKLPAVDVSAAKGSGGTIYVALINANPNEDADVDLAIDRANGRRISGQVLTAAKMDSRNTLGRPEEVRPAPFTGARWVGGTLRVRMPAKSIVVLSLK